MNDIYEVEELLADLYSDPTLQELGTWSLDASLEAAAIIAQVIQS
jgi:hypothetical protein